MLRPWDLSDFDYVDVFGPMRVGILSQYHSAGIKFYVRGMLFGQAIQLPNDDASTVEWAILTELVPTARLVKRRWGGRYWRFWWLRWQVLRAWNILTWRLRGQEA